MRKRSWLLFLYGLPTQSKTARVNLWRKLKKFGALQHISAYILPDEPLHLERLQWLAKQVQDEGGEASVIQTSQVDGLRDEAIVSRFQEERNSDYRAVMKELNKVLTLKRPPRARLHAAIAKAQRRFHEIQSIDYFHSPDAAHAESLLARAKSAQLSTTGQFSGVLDRSVYAGKIWLTRPGPGIDRVGSAWLIKRYIDPEAKFEFSSRAQDIPSAIPYDMPDVEFTHHGDDCTFETLLKRFALRDRSLSTIGEMIHDADLEDAKYGRVECVGLDLIFKGFRKSGLPDEEILNRGFLCFDALMSSVR